MRFDCLRPLPLGVILVLVPLLLGLSAPAHGYPDEGKRKKRSEFDFGDPPDAGPTQPGVTKGRQGRPIDRSEAAILRELEALRRWPNRSGQRAAEQLFIRGRQVVPYLVRVLESEDHALKPGAAWVLGKVGEDVHVQTILKAASQRMNASRADVFFKAAYSLSPEQTKRWLISFLALANRPVFRRAATRFLERKLEPADRHRVLQLLEASKPFVRISGLKLLRAGGVPDAEARMLAALSDLSPTVAYEAARLIGVRAKPKTLVALNDLARNGDARERAYGSLALVESARASGDNPFEDETLQSMAGRRGILHPEKLSRGAAAIGLAYGALDSTDPALTDLLDQSIVNILIDAVGGDHFRDYESVKPGAFAALRKLSGKDLPDSAVAWAQWWQGARDGFHARRPLQRLDANDVSRAVVQFSVVEANGMRRGATFVPASGSAEAGDSLLLKDEAFQALVEFLNEMGIFENKSTGANRADEHVAVVLRVTNQQRRMVVGPEDDAQNDLRPFARLKLRFEALADTNQWQLYVDADKFASRRVWWGKNVDLLAQAGPEERKRFLQSSIVYAFDDMKDDMARARGLYKLQQLGGPIGHTEAAVLAEQLANAPAFGAMEADGLRWLLSEGDARIRETLLSSLAQRTEQKAQDILAAILAEGGIEIIRNAFLDPRPGMRAAAAHATRLFLEGREGRAPSPDVRDIADKRLRSGLEVLARDTHPGVSIRALLALAYLGDESVVMQLERIYKGGNLGAKLEVTRALGYVPGRSAHPFLTRVLAEERGQGSGALRAAALQSMGRSKHKDASRLLAYYLLNDRNDAVQDAAADALAELGSESARFEIIDMLTQGENDPARRARLVDTLGRFEGEIVVDQLRRYLGDPAPQVQLAAAIRCADHGIGEAVPYLIRFLRRGQGPKRDEAGIALETLTSVRYDEPGYGERADRFQGWHDINQAGNPRTWFRDALKTRGYDVSALGAYIKGEQDLAAVPMLIRALRDGDPVIRQNASRALESLTGRQIGEVTRDTPQGEASEIANRWAGWMRRRFEEPPR